MINMITDLLYFGSVHQLGISCFAETPKWLEIRKKIDIKLHHLNNDHHFAFNFYFKVNNVRRIKRSWNFTRHIFFRITIVTEIIIRQSKINVYEIYVTSRITIMRNTEILRWTNRWLITFPWVINVHFSKKKNISF